MAQAALQRDLTLQHVEGWHHLAQPLCAVDMPQHSLAAAAPEQDDSTRMQGLVVACVRTLHGQVRGIDPFRIAVCVGVADD